MEIENHHIQALGRAVSDLLNIRDMDTETKAAYLAWAWESAGLADCCSKCDSMVWPYQSYANGNLAYHCHGCSFWWTCYYTPAWRNSPKLLAETILGQPT